MFIMELLPPDVRIFALDTMSHGPLAVTSSAPASSSSPEFYAFQRLLRYLYRSSTLSLQHVERLRGHLHRIYTIRTTDNTRYTLKVSPSRDTRLLRHEQRSLETEARVLELIRSSTSIPVPQRLSYDMNPSNTIGSQYLLRSYILGTSLADMLPYLSTAERSEVDRSLGSYFNSLVQLKLGSFGPTNRVYAGSGFDTWGEAFRSLLESVLRDSEDMLVSLPYDSIRYHTSTQRHVLDEITEPRLVALDVGDARSVLLHDHSRHIVGLLGFSNVVWGDPMLSSAFAGASEAFWEGYGGKPVSDRAQQIRGLLYYVYRSVVTVVTHYYRPQHGNEEYEARRALTWALNQLASL